MVIKLFKFILGLFLVTWLGGACKTQAPKAPEIPKVEVSSAPLEKSLLWEITGKKLSKPSYLFGTIHIIDKADFYLPHVVEEKIKLSHQVVFEIDLADMNNMSAIFTLLKEAMMKDGVKLRDLVTADEYKLIKDYFQKLGLPMVMLERVKPMFLSMLATGDGSFSDFTDGDMMSYEMELFNLAKEAQKSTSGLETIDYQVSLFDSIPYSDQAQMLVKSVQNNSAEGVSELDSTTVLYKSQDIEGMVDMVGEDQGIGKYEQILLINRNRNWINPMSKLMSTGSIFFAVGAGHLGGKDGVIRLLRQAGYQVEPIRFQFGDPLKTLKL